MSEREVVLAARISEELSDLSRVARRAERAIVAARDRPEDEDLYLDSAALNLHDFYSGVERLLQQVVSTIDRSVPAGREWHRELLRQVSLEIPGVRPAVLGTQTTVDLEELRRFRHVVRNVYAFGFDAERVRRLVELVSGLIGRLEHDLRRFAAFIQGADTG